MMNSRDALTGLPDRSCFDAAVRLRGAAATDSSPLGLIFIDVDRFKRVNDDHGHRKGDEVLVEVARRLATNCAEKGEVFRYGGEEIVILLPNFDLNESVAVAERCRRAMESKKCACLSITASFGVSVYPSLASSVEELIESADRAMYDAKNRGRNLVRYHGEPAPDSKNETRLPPRKVPEAETLTESQRADFRSRYFKHWALECPNDGAHLRTEETNPINQPTIIYAHCPQCGFQAQF